MKFYGPRLCIYINTNITIGEVYLGSTALDIGMLSNNIIVEDKEN